MAANMLRGKIWVLSDAGGKLIEDIDTDQIFHNAHLHITDIALMGAYALGNLEGWKDFAQKCRTGDIVIAGRNFGAGSSRQQAVDCFIALKVGAVLASSFAAIYFRNAVNSGFPILRVRNLEEIVGAGKLGTGDIVEFDIDTGEAGNVSRPFRFDLVPMSAVQKDIYEAGDLFAYGKKIRPE
jgi:3-isopropylmalate/(R)-2-methylmalate dehydratase small subunit